MHTKFNFLTLTSTIIIILLLFVLEIASTYNFVEYKRNLQLKQVFILSRHNIRTPLSENLRKITPLKWPAWKEDPGKLTAKGFLLEGYMGAYFAEYLQNQKLIENECPSREEIFIHASSTERTISSAKAFMEKVFPKCNFTIHHREVNGLDPIFSPIIHNASDAFKIIAINEMQSTLSKLNMNKSFEELENILNFKNSALCKLEHICKLSKRNNRFKINVNQAPDVSGSLNIGNDAVDAFLMAYYNGFDNNNVAWGKITSEDQWYTILDLNKSYLNVKFNTTQVLKDTTRPLIKYMTDLFLSRYKLVLLMGHDVNIIAILNLLKVKHFVLRDSLTQTPVGCKLVFEKWLDLDRNVYLLKVNLVYLSNRQLRNGELLSLDNPPRTPPLELNERIVVDEVYFLWNDFITFLENLNA